MQKLSILTVFGVFIILLSAMQSCTKDDAEPTEFIADNSTFANFDNWSLDAVNHGPSPSLSTAHAGNDTTVTRNVYFLNGQDRVNGSYPIGTAIVKHSTNPSGSVSEITAMVKRGNGFNPSTGDWEWFMLMADGSIATDSDGMAMRGGASMMGGMCNSCHAFASANDFTFSK